MKKLSLILFLLTGCATQANTSYQEVTVTTVEAVNQNPSTVCTLKNEEGEWKSTPNIPVSIHRDGNPMDVNCENKLATGTKIVEPDFEGEYLAMDIILVDLCLISCIVDGSNNAFYKYPSIITVPMMTKK